MRNPHEKSLYAQRCNNDEADLIVYVTTSRELAKLIDKTKTAQKGYPGRHS